MRPTGRAAHAVAGPTSWVKHVGVKNINTGTHLLAALQRSTAVSRLKYYFKVKVSQSMQGASITAYSHLAEHGYPGGIFLAGWQPAFPAFSFGDQTPHCIQMAERIGMLWIKLQCLVELLLRGGELAGK